MCKVAIPPVPELQTDCISPLVSGSGLGGLLLALFLQKECPQLEVTIYESARELAEIGAGVAAWPRVWEVLKYLGLEEALINAGGTLDGGGMFIVIAESRLCAEVACS